MASTIQLKTGTGSAVPSSLTQGEVGINIDNGLIYYGSGSGNSVKQLESFTHITASGDISASGDMFANSIKLAEGNGITFADEIEGPSIDIDSAGQIRIDSAGSTINFSRNATDAYIINPGISSHKFTGNITASENISASGTVEASSFKGTPIHLRAASQYIGSTTANNYYYGNNTQGFYHHQHTGKLASLDFSSTVQLGNGVQHNTIIVPFDIKDIELMGGSRTNSNGSSFAMWIAKLDRPGIGDDSENPHVTFLASASATPDSNTVFAKIDITGSHSFVSNMTASKGEQLVVFYQPYGGSEVHKYYWTLNARTAE